MSKKQTTIDLGSFDKKPVLSTGIRITNAGDGLSKALQVDPKVMHHNEKIYVVLETEVTNVAFPPVKDTDGVQRLHTLRAGRSTVVDADLVKELLDAQEERIKGYSEPALPFGADEKPGGDDTDGGAKLTVVK
jgi:hypothetical protein